MPNPREGGTEVKREYVERIFSLALYELLKKRKIDDIRVQEICDGCGMSKRTFYNHFRDKYELAAYLYNAISTDRLSGLLTEDYFGEMAEGNSRKSSAKKPGVPSKRRSPGFTEVRTRRLYRNHGAPVLCRRRREKIRT